MRAARRDVLHGKAIRDAESRVMFTGYNPVAYKLSIWTLSAVMCAVAGAPYVPQVGHQPRRDEPGVGHRDGDLGGHRRASDAHRPIVGAFFVTGAKSWFTVAFPECWLFFLGAQFIAVTLLVPHGIIGLLKGKGVRQP